MSTSKTPKKRKRETVEDIHPRITYDAPSRTFDRRFKEQTLDEMKDVIRKKLGVATSIPLHLSQLRDGKSVDLEDDDDFDAFYDFAHDRQAAHVKVVVGSDTPIIRPLPNGDLEFTPSSAKKKKKKTSAASSSELVDLPPQKKRRVSFVATPDDQPEQNASVPVTPEKKKRKHVADSSPPPDEAPSTKSTEKKKKKKKTPATFSEELTNFHSENDPETIPGTPSPKKLKKRTREEDTSQVPSLSQPQRTGSLEEEEDSRPAKKSKMKRKDTDDEPISSQKSRSKSVPPTSTRNAPTVDPSPSVEPESSIKSKKKGKERNVSEPPSADATGSPEQIRHDEASSEKKKKGKSKVKADESISVDPSTSAKSKAAEVKSKAKLAKQKEIPPNDSTKKKEKAAESPQVITPKDTTSRKDKDLDKPSVETKPSGRKRKTQDAETSKPSKSRTGQETSQVLDDSLEQKSEKLMAATLEAIQAVLERKGIPTSASSQVLQPASPQPALQAATSEGEEELPDEEEEHCPLCDGSPTHDQPLCPVIKGGVRAMRKRVGQLEKDTSGDETKKELRQQVIAELQAIIQKRSRKRKILNVATNDAVAVEKAAVTQNKDPQPATPAPIVDATKTAKQVDVVSPSTREVDVVPSIASSKPVKPTPSVAKPLKPTKQSSSLQPPPASQQPSSSQKSITKTAQDKVTTERLMANLPLVSEPSLVILDLPFKDLSQVTDNDMQSIIHGPNFSVADLPSSDDDNDDDDDDDDDDDEQDEEASFLDEDEPGLRRLSQSSAVLEYPSPSDAEEEDDESAEGRVSNAKAMSLSTDLTDDRQHSEESFLTGEGDTSFRELDTRGSSREMDKTGDDAFDAALTKDLAILDGVLPISGKRKGVEVDSDTAVGSQVEEIVDLRAKEKKVKSKTTTTDPIEPSKEPFDEPELILSDDDPPAQSTPKVESIIRTRSQRKKNTDQQEDSAIQAPKIVKKAKKITELPVPSLPSSVRVIKSSNPSTNGKVGSKTPIKDAKRSSNTRSKSVASGTSKGKAATKASSQISAANGAVSKPESLYKITPMEQLAEAINIASGRDNDITGSQWAVLQESNPLTETPGQVDELHSDFHQTPLMQSQDRDPLFLPSATQQSFPYSQFSEIFATPGGEDVHESDDENEVLATVVKPVPARPYRGLSQIASSQTFAAPNFQSANFGKMRDPESLYGKNRHDVVSESDSSSESDEDKPASHIPASRRAGLLPRK